MYPSAYCFKDIYYVLKKNVNAHHKSGTVLTRNIAKALCGFLTPSQCNLRLYDEGLEEVLLSYSSENALFLHAIRNPIDMLLSGYLYHKACNEPGWTDARYCRGNFLTPYKIPSNFPLKSVNQSYCNWLQTKSEEEGLRMELIRSMHSTAGIGKMLQDMIYLESVDATVFDLCMSEAKKVMPLVESYVKPWMVSPERRTFRVKDDVSHHTNSTEQQRLLDIAYKVIIDEIPPLLLATFPCPSQFYLTVSNYSSYIYDLEVDRNRSPPKLLKKK